jgi:hypothetical protein
VGEVHCFGCGAAVPDVAGPAHAYMLSAPGCWALYGSLLAWRSSLAEAPGVGTSQYLIDTYAVQHPTNPDRRNRQSVAVHLMSLCAALEHDIPGTRLRHLIGEWTHREYPLLLPRPSSFSLTLAGVAATPPEARSEAVLTWAGSAWADWSAHHERVRGWLADALSPTSGIG